MDIFTAISKVRTALDRLAKDEPKCNGTYKVTLKLMDGKVVKLDKRFHRSTL
jgi:hypothetical protein